MSTTVLEVLPFEWNDTIIRGDTWPIDAQLKVPGDYTSATWSLRARIGGADPFIDLDQDDMTITYDADEEFNGITGWTTVTWSLTGDDTLALETTTRARWAMRSTKDGTRRTWFAGRLDVINTALEGSS